MPRVSLTAAQKEAYAIGDVLTMLIRHLNAQQGLRRMTDKDFSKLIGISDRTWRNWNTADGIAKANITTVITAAVRVGLVISVGDKKGMIAS